DSSMRNLSMNFFSSSESLSGSVRSLKRLHNSYKLIIIAQLPPFICDMQQSGVLRMHRIVLMPGGTQQSLDICHSVGVDAVCRLDRRNQRLFCCAFEKFEQLVRNLKRILSLLFGSNKEVLNAFIHGLQKLVHPLVFEVGSDIEQFLAVRRMFYLLFPVEYPFMHRYFSALHSYFYVLRISKDVAGHISVLRWHRVAISVKLHKACLVDGCWRLSVRQVMDLGKRYESLLF